VLSAVLASEMAFSNSRRSPDPDPSASSRFNSREGMQLEEGYTLNKSLVVYELFRILIYEGWKRFTSDGSSSYVSQDVIFFLLFQIFCRNISYIIPSLLAVFLNVLRIIAALNVRMESLFVYFNIEKPQVS